MAVRIQWKGPQVQASVHAAAVDALFEGAEHILEEAGRNVPLDEGTLSRSGEAGTQTGNARSDDRGNVSRTSQPSGTDLLVAFVSYDTPYAARLHEHPEYHFQHNRKGKWLETAFKERVGAVRKFIADKIRKALKS